MGFQKTSTFIKGEVIMKQKWYNQIWIWGALISLVSFTHLILNRFNIVVTIDFTKLDSTFWTAIGSIGAAISVIIAVVSIVMNNKRTEKQATYDAFKQFKKDVEGYENKIHSYKTSEIKEIIEHKNDQRQSDWNTIKLYLSAVERFSVGVNEKIFCAKIVDKMGGYFLYEMYNLIYPIIVFKREQDKNDRIYEEFKKMVNSIIDIRNKKPSKKIEHVQ